MFGDPVEQYSPDNRYRLTFHNFEEPRMCYDICKFDLTDMHTYSSIEFDPLWALGIGQKGFSWSENQSIVSLPVVNFAKDFSPMESFFIYNSERNAFSSIRFANCWILSGNCHNDYIEIEYDDHIPGENPKYPTKDLKKPDKIRFNFSELQWTSVEFLEQFCELNKNTIVHSFKPLDNGWRPFKGQLPQTTEIIVWELKQFAEYGDAQSLKWFSEIQEFTSKIDYWVKASQYLGVKNRE
jgi:hypothetical protein